MNISSFHIQNVIKAYGQRIGKRNSALSKKGTGQATPDSISISAEARKKQLIHEITNNIVNAAKEQDRLENVSNDIIEKIGARLGEHVDIIPQKNKNTGFRFKILSKGDEETIKELSFDDLKKLVEEIYEEKDALK